MSIPDLLRRAIAWLRRNPEARADAIELAAAAARDRADVREREGMARTAGRLRRRAEVLDARAQQLSLLAEGMAVTPPGERETYEGYLDSFGLLGRGFVLREIVRDGSERKVHPPHSMWSAMVPTLALAMVLRDRMRQLGARGLAINAAYRPVGGEADSRHKHNAALDLDLLPGDLHLAGAFARTASVLWREHEDLKVGIGTYAPAGKLYTNRVHLDAGWRHRCWQGIGRNAEGRYLFSKHPAALVLAAHDETDPASRELVARP